MQVFYHDLSQESYEEKALDKATAFFFELVGEAKEACLARIAEVYGQESYDLLKNYGEGLRLLGKGFHKKYKKQILACVLPFLPKVQAVEVIILNIRQVFFDTVYNGSNIDDPEAFYRFMLNRLNTSFANIQPTIASYAPYQAEVSEIFQVERYVFIKKAEILYQDYCRDMALIWENIRYRKNSLEHINYFMPYFNVNLPIAYEYTEETEDGISSISFKIVFSPEEIMYIERNALYIKELLNKGEKTIHDIFSQNILPVLQGTCKAELHHYLAEQELAMAYHLKNAEATELLAKKDMQNVLLTYDTHHNKGQSMALSLELDLRAGKLQASINSKLYSSKMRTLIGGLAFSIITLFVGIFMRNSDASILILIGFATSLIFAHGIYTLANPE